MPCDELQPRPPGPHRAPGPLRAPDSSPFAFSTVLAVLALLLVACSPPRPNLLLVTLDTTRPDHLGVYGYSHATSPNLEALARDGRTYERVYSTSNWTLAAHASLFTGRFPRSHGATYHANGELALSDAITGKSGYASYTARRLPASQITLAGWLRERGYETGAVVAGPWMKRLFGLDAGFDSYDDDGIAEMAGRLAEDVSNAAIAWLESRDDSRPFFLFLNYYDPHWPYGDPKKYAQRFLGSGAGLDANGVMRAQIAALYDGEIFYADEEMGRVVAWLRERALYEDTLIVITADHGELLGEHGHFGHGSSMFEEELRIPLVVKPAHSSSGAGERGARHGEALQILDVFPLVLGELGVDLPPTVQGSAPPEIGHPLFAEALLPIDGGVNSWQALYSHPHKLHVSAKGQRRLYDLQRDPDEARDLSRRRRVVGQKLARELNDFVSTLPVPDANPGDALPLDAETRELLESLGYLEGPKKTDGAEASPD